MEHLTLSDTLEINIEKAFKIISSIELYPKFVPGYKDVNLLEKKDDYIKAVIVPSIPIKNIVMEAKLTFPEKISFTQIEGPVDIFKGEWQLHEINYNSTKIDFQLEYYVKKFLIRQLVYKFIKVSFKDIISSFKIMAKRV